MRLNIEAERARAQLTKTELARALGITTKTYMAYVQGKRAVPSDKLVEMADMFNCTTDYLLGRDTTQQAANQ